MKRIGNSFKGIVGGFIFILIGIVLLWWNEGNNVRNIKTTNEMAKTYIDVASDKIDQSNEGKLIATNGKLINEQELYDSMFEIKVKTPVLKRVVEMYQWEEESTTNEDGDTTYTYKKVWSEEIINSSNFNKSGYTNPNVKPYNSDVWYSTDVKVGAFSLSSNQIQTLSTEGVFVDFNQEKIQELSLTSISNYITNSTDINNPQIGDIRISFVYNNSTEISVLATQHGNTFVDFVSGAGKRINRVMDGIHSGEEMINIIKTENKIIKWLLRLVGLILISSGIGAILKPISAITSYVPILGSIVGSAVGLISFLLALALSLVVIAVAWIRFRPILGISLLVVVGVIVIFLIVRGKTSKNSNTPLEEVNNDINQNNNQI